MRVEVTQKHIDEGLDYMATADCCVIARAIRDSSKEFYTYVGVYTANVGEKKYFLPEEVTRFIKQCVHYSHSRTFVGRWIFGDDRPKPFSFELN